MPKKSCFGPLHINDVISDVTKSRRGGQNLANLPKKSNLLHDLPKNTIG